MAAEDFEYVSVADILTLHEEIVAASEETEPGVSSHGDIDYAVMTIQEGHFGQGPATLHEKAATLFRLLTANHPFVDGNKRTALLSTVAFYALNGYRLDYGDEVRELLKRIATDQSTVPDDELVTYLDSNTVPLPDAEQQRYRALLSSSAKQSSQRNDYTDNNGN